MTAGLEINMVVSDSRTALEFYEKIFDAKRLDISNNQKGLNEAFLVIAGYPFHLMDENPEYKLFAPKAGVTKSEWFSLFVSDAAKIFNLAVDAGCKVIQPITEIREYGVIEAVFYDPFGYVWFLRQFPDTRRNG